MSSELIRHLLIFGGFITIGLNLAVIVEARRVVEAVTAWRLYMTGQIFIDLALIYGLHRHIHNAIGRGVILTAIGLAITLVSLVLLESANHRKQAHRRKERSAEIPLAGS